MTRLALAAAVVGAGCASPAPPQTGFPGGPAVEVAQPDGGPVQLFWQPPRARAVEIRHAGTGALAWRAHAGAGRHGVDWFGAPLWVQAVGPPPGIYPPDGRGVEAGAPALVAGERYTVTVAPCSPSGEGTARPSCLPADTLRATFTARRSSASPR